METTWSNIEKASEILGWKPEVDVLEWIKKMSKFCALKSAGMGNRFKIYVSYLARYDEVLVEKNEDRYIFTNFKPCNDIDILGQSLLVNENEENYIKKYKTIDQLYNDTPQYFIDKYVPIWNSLKINPEIKNYIDDFTKDWDKDDMVAIHIRTNYPPVDDGTRSVWVVVCTHHHKNFSCIRS